MFVNIWIRETMNYRLQLIMFDAENAQLTVDSIGWQKWKVNNQANDSQSCRWIEVWETCENEIDANQLEWHSLKNGNSICLFNLIWIVKAMAAICSIKLTS